MKKNYVILVPMNYRLVMMFIGAIEMAIGAITLGTLGAARLLPIPQKSLAVTVFVFASAILSATLGVGIVRTKEWARLLLVFFSGYVILTKVLLAAGLLQFNGELITTISPVLKNSVSVLYHGLVIIIATRPAVKRSFAHQ